MSLLWNKDNTLSLLSGIRFLEDLANKKEDITYGKTLIIKQQEYVLRLLRNRETEERILNDIISMVRNEEKILEKTSDTSIVKITQIKDFELNFEAIFKKEIRLIKDDLIKLNKNYELQKTLDSNKYNEYILIEKQEIKDIKTKLNNILNSKEQIQKYIGELSKIGTLMQHNEDYTFIGLKIPSNIILGSPLSKYDLEPFLSAYNNYRDVLKNVKIKLVYKDMGNDFMRAQYDWKFIFNNPEDRVYILQMSNTKKAIDGVVMSGLTFDEKKGWFGHELNHIVQYSKMSNRQLLGFTFAYTLNFLISKIPGINKWSRNYLRKIESRTDIGTINKGLGFELARGRHHFVNESNAPIKNKEDFLKVYPNTNELLDLNSKEYFDKLNKPRR